MNAILNFVTNLIQNPVQTVVRAVTQFVSNPVGTVLGVIRDITSPQSGGSSTTGGSSSGSGTSGSSSRPSNRGDDADRRGADEARREAQRRAEEARREREERFNQDLAQNQPLSPSIEGSWLPFDLLIDVISNPSSLTQSLAQMMRHEPETLEFIGTRAPSLEAALNMLFADAGRDDDDDAAGMRLLDTFLQKRQLPENSITPNSTVELPATQIPKLDPPTEFLLPAASRLAGQIPNNFLPWISAIDFGLRGFIKALNEPDKGTSALGVAFQEAIGGFNYGLGTARYIRERGLTSPATHQPSEGEIALGAIIAYHEGSRHQFGSAFEMMAARTLYNRAELLNPVYATTDDPDIYLRPGDHVSSGHWSGVFDTYLHGETPSWDEVLSIANNMLAHPDEFPNFTESYASAQVAAEVFNLGLPDPTNRGIELDSNPAPGYGEFGGHYPSDFRVGSNLVSSGYETTPLSFMRGVINTIAITNDYYRFNSRPYSTHGVFLRINSNGAVEPVNWNWRQSIYVP